MTFAKDRIRGLVILCAALISFLIHYPGKLNPDSARQLREALSGQFTDWHPPVMAALWRLLLNIDTGPAPLLALHLGLYWLAVWAIWEACRDCPGWRQLLPLLAALHPLPLVLLGYVVKDVGLASSLLAAFGLLFRQQTLERPVSPLAGAATALLLAYAALVRPNGLFAVPPLLLYWLRPDWLRPSRLIPITALFLAVGIPASSIINHDLLAAKRSNVEASLQMFDIAGIQHFSGDTIVMPMPSGCYTPFFWDTFWHQPACRQVFERVTRGPNASPAALTRTWIHAIARHPLAYAQHRLTHFNSATYFLVEPAHRCRWLDNSDCAIPRFKLILKDAVRKNALYWPCIWLALGVWLLLQANATVAVRALAWSGLLYGFGFLLVGVATNARYHLWTTVSIAIAAGLFFAREKDLLPALKRAAVPVGIVAAAGYAARIMFMILG